MIAPTREELKANAERLGWRITEPYQIYNAPWEPGYVLMDDTGMDKVSKLEHGTQLSRKSEDNILFTRSLPDGASAQIYVDGHGHTLDVTIKTPMGLDF